MLKALARLFRSAPAATHTRALEAAAGGRRWSNDGFMGATLNADLASGGPTARRRAMQYARNNPHAARATQVIASNLVGTGIRPQSEHPDRLIRDATDALWSRWVPQADAGGTSDFYELQTLAARSLVEAGEAFVRFRPRLPNGSYAGIWVMP